MHSQGNIILIWKHHLKIIHRKSKMFYCMELVAEKSKSIIKGREAKVSMMWHLKGSSRMLEEDIESTRREVRDCLDKLQRRRLMHLVDTQNLLREETSLTSFTAGFKLAWGLSKELEADGLYSFDEEETERVRRQVRKEE